MSGQKISAILATLSARVISMSSETRKMTPEAMAVSWYKSDVYAMLEKEESKLWHLSAKSLSSLFEQELSGQSIVYPEEV
jgi:hypothetical protein